MDEAYLVDPIRSILYDTLPREFFTKVNNIVETILFIRTQHDFNLWCSRTCPVDLVLEYVLPCKAIDIVSRGDIAMWMCRRNRATSTQKIALKAYKDTLIAERRIISKDIKTNTILGKRKRDIDTSDKSKRIKEYEIEVVPCSTIFPLSVDVLLQILSYAGMTTSWKVRITCKAFYNAYTYTPLRLVVSYCDKRRLIGTTKLLLLMSMDSKIEPPTDSVVSTIDMIDACKVKKKVDISYHDDQYVSDMFDIVETFASNYNGTKVVSFWPNPNIGIPPLEIACQIVSSRVCIIHNYYMIGKLNHIGDHKIRIDNTLHTLLGDTSTILSHQQIEDIRLDVIHKYNMIRNIHHINRYRSSCITIPIDILEMYTTRFPKDVRALSVLSICIIVPTYLYGKTTIGDTVNLLRPHIRWMSHIFPRTKYVFISSHISTGSTPNRCTTLKLKHLSIIACNYISL